MRVCLDAIFGSMFFSCLICTLISAEGLQEFAQAEVQELKYKTRELKDLTSSRVAVLDYNGDYSPSANSEAAPPPVRRRRSLLQNYNPNHRASSNSSRKLLHGYYSIPWATNQQEIESPFVKRRLLQDYTPVANQRSPSSPSHS